MRSLELRKLYLSKKFPSFSRYFSLFFASASARPLGLIIFVLVLTLNVFTQSKFENRQISDIFIRFVGLNQDITPAGNSNIKDVSSAEKFRAIVRGKLGQTYSAVTLRDALQALYDSENVISAEIEAIEDGAAGVDLRFVIRRKSRAEKVVINIADNTIGDEITEQQLLLRVNLLNPGTAITQQTLKNNADLILEYLRERGFYNAEVTFTQQPENSTEVTVVFNVKPGAQAKIESFKINITGFDAAKVLKDLKLQPGEFYSRRRLTEDLTKIRKALREEKFLAPELDEEKIIYDSEKNTINIELNGKVGATVNVSVEAGDKKLGEKTQTKLLTIKREGTLDYAAIIEGSRRLRNFYQEKGYFFAEVNAICSVNPEFTEAEAGAVTNETDVLCSALSGAGADQGLSDRVVEVKYKANLSRQLRLVDIRLRGTDKITIGDIQSVLKSQEKSLLGVIPFFGYGRGYTSNEILESDRLTVLSLMRELGYRRAEVSVEQGVTPNGEDLIITFVVNEGIPTGIAGIDIEGNTMFSDNELKAKLPGLIGKNFSRARARNGVKEISQFYSQQGFYDARVNYSLVELPEAEGATQDTVKVVYTVENEGRKVFVNRILINGNEMTERDTILKAINLRSGEVLRAVDIFTSEQNLYSSDAFSLVEIKAEPAGETADGKGRLSDIIVNVTEQKPRLITYGGGYSTDIGANGFFDIRHFNLFGKLQQGGARIRASRLQQNVQIDYINPRFLNDGKTESGAIRYSPLTFTAQYQRDSTVTRFFRSTLDKGAFGIVQRVDEKGNAIDEFGAKTSDPTINRLTFSAETSRTISRKNHSILFARYKFEDVRIFEIESLLIKELLRPDSRIRTSGLGANFVFDTRENCSIKYTILDIIAKGDPGDPCRYSPSDPTRGIYLTADYNFSLPALGANIGFQKFQGSFNTFYTFPRLKSTTLAGRAILGLAKVFSRNQDFSSQFPDLEDILPISERFFAGGSTTLRGFEFEQAGPRVVVMPQGIFRNQKGEVVPLSPFSVPFGGNALAIINLEARIPVTTSVRVVPFYDGGNVFRRVGDIFKKSDTVTNDVFRQNLRSVWSNTVGLGLRLKTPIGGEFAVDYGYLLNPPIFFIPQTNGTNNTFQPRQGQLHFRFAQAF